MKEEVGWIPGSVMKNKKSRKREEPKEAEEAEEEEDFSFDSDDFEDDEDDPFGEDDEEVRTCRMKKTINSPA